jgi:hypothetical protein
VSALAYLRLSVVLAVVGLWRVLAGLDIQTVTLRNTMAAAYGTNAPFAALYSTVPGASAGTELSGGSPAYARKATSWSAPSSSSVTSTQTFDVGSGSTVAGAGIHSLVTGGTYLDGTSVTSQGFSSQGTYQLTLTYTQT